MFTSLPNVPAYPNAQTLKPLSDADMTLPRHEETILIVDDEQALLHLNARVLRMAGYQVLEARDAQEALDVYEAHDGAIHLLLTDIHLPNQSGAMLANRLKHRLPDLKVLFISGMTQDLLEESICLDDDARFLQKPFTPWKLIHIVRLMLDQPVEAA